MRRRTLLWSTAQPVLCPAAGSRGQADLQGGRIFQSSPPATGCRGGGSLVRPFALPSQANPPWHLTGAEPPWNLAPLCRGGKRLVQPPHEARGGQGTSPRSWRSQVVNSHLPKCVLFSRVAWMLIKMLLPGLQPPLNAQESAF